MVATILLLPHVNNVAPYCKQSLTHHHPPYSRQELSMGLAVLALVAASQTSLMRSCQPDTKHRMGAPVPNSGPADPLMLLVVLETDAASTCQHPLKTKLRVLASECSSTCPGPTEYTQRSKYSYTVRQLRRRILTQLQSRPGAMPQHQSNELDLRIHATKLGDTDETRLCPEQDELDVIATFGSRIGVRARWIHDDEVRPRKPLLAIRGRYYDFSGSVKVGNSELEILEVPNQHNAGTSFNVWDGSLLLSQYLEQNYHQVQYRRVLELGAGCGLAGLSAAAVGASHVTLTDLPGEPLRHLQANVDRNAPSLPDGATIEVKPCDWWDMSHHAWLSTRQYHTVIVADCVWTEDLVEPLLSVLRTLTQLDAHSQTTDETLESSNGLYGETIVELTDISELVRRKTTRDERSSSTIDESQHDHVRGPLQRTDSLGDSEFPFLEDDEDGEDNDDQDDQEDTSRSYEEARVEKTQVIIAYQRRGQSTHQALWKGLRQLFTSIQHVHVPDQPEVLSVLVCVR